MSESPRPRIPRHATQRLSDGRSAPAELADWRHAAAYVLLADPGAGKTVAFVTEARAMGAHYVTAGDFVSLPSKAGPSGATLFIDALDEMRARPHSQEEPLNAIRRRLDELGRPRFRLACREADWIGAVDSAALRAASPSGELMELRLEPLSEDEIRCLLGYWPDKVPDPDAFWREAEQHHITAMLGNPLILELMVDATRNGHLPSSRLETYERACERLVSEENQVHRANRRRVASRPADLLEDAGLLCATLLLAGLEAVTEEPVRTSASNDISLDAIPSELGVGNARNALASKLFIADGERRVPRHRTVGEYLAATVIARRVEEGLVPMPRVLTLMSGFDGGIVEPLRGLHAWLAARCPTARPALIERDPLGVVLYGDVRCFETSEKQQILEAFEREAKRFVWFRNGDWAAHPFGALGTRDMAPIFAELLRSNNRQPPHQSLLDCVLDAIRYGDPLLELLPELERVVRDCSYRDDIRNAAVLAWLAQSRANPSAARGWLEDIRVGLIADPRDEISGWLLDALYPDHLSPMEVMRYFHLPRVDNFAGSYQLFWDGHLIDRTPRESRPVLADQFAELTIDRSNLNADAALPGFIGDLLTAALDSSDAPESPLRIQRWLKSGLDAYGFAALKDDDGAGVRNWLSAHPETQKSVLAQAYAKLEPDPKTGQLYFWQCEELLHRAQRPRDWFKWLLDQAAAAPAESKARAQYCFELAARAAIEPSVDYDISMEDLEAWVNLHQVEWPDATAWLENAWTYPLEHCLANQQRRNREYAAKRNSDRERRQKDLAPHADAIRAGTAPAGLMHQLALAYRHRFRDIRGETPEARIQDYLGGDEAEVAGAIAGLEATLARTDLPTVDEILKLGLEQREHYIRPACLLGAELVLRSDPMAPVSWSDELASVLVAFWLTDGTGNLPEWFSQLARHRPMTVAKVLLPYAKQQLRSRPEQSITGLWSLAKDPDQRELARAVLPALLKGFPSKANEAQLRRLNQELLPAAVLHLDQLEVDALASRRLALKSLDAGQRIAWLVATLVLQAETRSRELVSFVGKSQTRAVQLAIALTAQMDRRVAPVVMPVTALASLISIVGPLATPERPSGAFWVGDTDHRRDLVHGFIHQLAAHQNEDSAAELNQLRASPLLQAWATTLDAAIVEQARRLRAARFEHASANAVARTLANKAPANALDLASLVIDKLNDLVNEVRHDDTNSLRLFWRDEGAGRSFPKIENECRDVLLKLLRPSLKPLSVHVDKEGSAANDGRVDLRASTTVERRRIVVPIEIKKEDHRSVWTAWHDQLDGRYTTDPAAQGVGIYLVLWFGHKPKAAPNGRKPVSAMDLETLLRAEVPAADHARLTICVIDLSLPNST